MIGRRTVLSMVNLGVGALLGLVALKVTALYFGKGPMGEAAYAIAILGILYVFCDLSMSDAHVKRVSEGRHVGDCFATFAVFRVVATALFAIVTLGGLFVWSIALGKPFEDTTALALLLILLYYVAKSAQSVAQSTFEARLESARAQVISLLETIGRVGLTVLFALVYAALAHGGGPLAGRLDPTNPVWAWVAAHPGAAVAATFAIGSAVGAVAGFVYLRRSLERGRFRWDILRSYFAFALPLFPLAAIGIVSFFIDRLALGLFGNEIDTGDFEGPRRLVSVLEGIGGAVGLLLFPRISQLLAQGDSEQVESLVDRSVRYLSMLTLPIVAFFVAFPGPVIRLTLDNAWLGNSLTLSLLAFWVYLITIARPHLTLLMGANRPGLVARIGVTVAFTHIVLNLVLVPDDIRSLGLPLFGLKSLGAAIATVLSGLLYYGLIAYAARVTTGYRPPWRVLKHAAASAIMAGGLLAIHLLTPFELGRWYTFLVYVPLGGILYVAALVALRELTREDVAYALDVIHPGEMGRYIKSELWAK